MENKRQYGLDLLRILAMILITAIHYVSYSNILSAPALTNYNRVVLSGLSALFVAAVNLFVLITGYFSCEKKLNGKRVFTLWTQVFILGVVLLLVGFFVLNQPFRLTTMLKSIFPISTMHYWFFTMYVMLMLASPMINLFVDRLTEPQHRGFCIVGFFMISIFFVSNPFVKAELYVADARGFVWMTYLYIVGAGFKKHGWSISSKKTFFGLFLCLAVLFTLEFFQVDGIANCKLLDANSVFPFLLSLLLFSLFKSIDVRKRSIKIILARLSAASFLVYILQEHETIRFWYWNLFQINCYVDSPLLIFNIALSLIVLWPVALLLQWLLSFLTPGISIVYSALEKLTKKFIISKEG